MSKNTKESPVITKETKFENVNNWLMMGIDLESRRIHLDMEVDEVMATLVIRGLLKMSDISYDPIELYLSSFGGDAYAGLSIYDAIRSCPCDVVIHANGKIMSAGFLIYLAGDLRLSAKHTTFMMHSVTSTSEGKVKDQEIDVQESKRLNNIMFDILAERTKMKKAWWYRKILSHDVYLDVNQAREYGVVDTDKTKKPLTKIKKTVKVVKKLEKKSNVRKSKKRRFKI